jgi:hypothetical protein
MFVMQIKVLHRFLIFFWLKSTLKIKEYIYRHLLILSNHLRKLIINPNVLHKTKNQLKMRLKSFCEIEDLKMVKIKF